MGLLKNTDGKIIKAQNQNWSVGDGLKFDGVNDYVQLTQSIDIANDHSFSFWWKPNLYGGNQRLLSNVELISQGGFIISAGNIFGEMRIYFGIYSPTMSFDNCSIYTTAPIPNALMYVVIVKNTQTRANWKIYIDGINVGVETLGANNTATGTMTGNPLVVGTQAQGNLFNYFLNGDIHDFKIFNKALTQAEVTWLYERKGLTVPATAIANLIADYRFNNKSGFNLTDSAGGNNGTLTNYTAGDVTLGATNKWVNADGTSVLYN